MFRKFYANNTIEVLLFSFNSFYLSESSLKGVQKYNFNSIYQRYNPFDIDHSTLKAL